MVITESQLQKLAEKAHLNGQSVVVIWVNFLSWGEFNTQFAPGGEHFDGVFASLVVGEITPVYRPSNGLSLFVPLSVEKLRNDSNYFQVANSACEREGLQGPATFFPSGDAYDTVSLSFRG